jgi:hypothetical protein
MAAPCAQAPAISGVPMGLQREKGGPFCNPGRCPRAVTSQPFGLASGRKDEVRPERPERNSLGHRPRTMALLTISLHVGIEALKGRSGRTAWPNRSRGCSPEPLSPGRVYGRTTARRRRSQATRRFRLRQGFRLRQPLCRTSPRRTDCAPTVSPSRVLPFAPRSAPARPTIGCM